MNRAHHKPEGGVLPCLFDRIIRSLDRDESTGSRSIDKPSEWTSNEICQVDTDQDDKEKCGCENNGNLHASKRLLDYLEVSR